MGIRAPRSFATPTQFGARTARNYSPRLADQSGILSDTATITPSSWRAVERQDARSTNTFKVSQCSVVAAPHLENCRPYSGVLTHKSSEPLSSRISVGRLGSADLSSSASPTRCKRHTRSRPAAGRTLA